MSHVAECKPWNNNPNILATATAHECALNLIHIIFLAVFPNGCPIEGLHSRVDEQMDELIERIEKLLPQVDYTSTLKVAARMNRERTLVLANPPKWAKQHTGKHSGFSITELNMMTGLGNSTINKYQDLASVAKAGPGKQDFRQSLDNTITLLEIIITQIGNKTIKSNCQSSLEEPKQIPNKSVNRFL
jgi:hypothetical protein